MSPPERDAPRRDEPGPPREVDLNVLVVDDDPADALLTRIAIEQSRYQCRIETASTDDEAFERLVQLDTAVSTLILADRRRGAETIGTLIAAITTRLDEATTHIVLLSGLPPSGDLSPGITAALTKPFTTDDFEQLVTDHINPKAP